MFKCFKALAPWENQNASQALHTLAVCTVLVVTAVVAVQATFPYPLQSFFGDTTFQCSYRVKAK